MYVKLEAVELHAQLVETFGLPEPTSSNYEELFGWYHFDDETLHWSYDPTTEVWDVKRGVDSLGKSLNGAWPSDLINEAEELMGTLRFMQPPQNPAASAKAPQAQRFIHNGWLFAWYYFPELMRWELAPIEKL